MLDPSWVGTRVEYGAYYDMDEEENKRELRTVDGNILQVSDGTWLIPGKRTKCYKKKRGRTCGMGRRRGRKIAHSARCKSIEECRPKKSKNYCEGGWRKEVEVNYGI